jgi:AraC family transcriptional regulator
MRAQHALRSRIIDFHMSRNFSVTETQYGPREEVSKHCHERAHISITLIGSYREYCGSVVNDFRAGHTIFHTTGESHSNCFGEQGARVLSLGIHPHFLADLRRFGFDLDRQSVWSSLYCRQLATRLRQTASLVEDASSGLAIDGLAMELCAEILKRRRTTKTNPLDWLGKVDSLLRDRFREPVTLAELAEAVRIHPVHIARGFHKHFGRPVGEHIRLLRIEAACEELRTSQSPIAEIAVHTGFCDQSHLSRTLKRYIGVSPQEFRNGKTRQ